MKVETEDGVVIYCNMQETMKPQIPVGIEEKKKVILIVDDEAQVRLVLVEMCYIAGYDTLEAGNGKEAVDLATRHVPDLILLDINMPEMNGFEVIEVLRNTDATKRIPIIILTIYDSLPDRLTGISKGVNDYMIKPCNSLELSLRIRNNLKIKEYQDFLKKYNAELEARVRERTQKLDATLQQLKNAHDSITQNTIETIHRLTMTSEFKDFETGAHIKRIGYYSQVLARVLSKDPSFIEMIFFAAPLHDIGKVGIPDRILLKPGTLTEEEWEIMKTHTQIGARILSNSKSVFLKMGEIIALHHHERWDSSGYPYSVNGEKIPLEAKIVNIMDIYDALRSKRPYKAPLDHETAIHIIRNGDKRTLPSHFDPIVLQAFLDSHHEFAEIFMSTKD